MLPAGTFHRIIDKETEIPVTQAHAPFTNAADMTTELLVQVFQGEEEFIVANTLIGEVRISDLQPLPRGGHMLEIKFSLDQSDTLSIICKDLRTGKEYIGTLKFNGVTKMSGDEIRKRREQLMQMMKQGAGAPVSAAQPGAGTAPGNVPDQPPVVPGVVDLPNLPLEKIPQNSRVFWQQSMEILPRLEAGKQAMLKSSMDRFANAVLGGNAKQIEDAEFLLQDALLEAKS